MARLGWIVWGILFSVVLFFSIYFLIYARVTGSDEPVILKLGNIDVSGWGIFFSDVKNVVITSLVIGFLLGFITSIGSRKENIN